MQPFDTELGLGSDQRPFRTTRFSSRDPVSAPITISSLTWLQSALGQARASVGELKDKERGIAGLQDLEILNPGARLLYVANIPAAGDGDEAHGHLIGADGIDARAVGLEQTQRHRLSSRIDTVTAGVES